MQAYANPTRFMGIAERALPYLGVATAALIGVGLWLGLFVAPADYQQGETVRIMFVHVPSAWMAMFVYAFMAAMSVASLVWKHPLADAAARSAAPIGAGFTFLALATGALWGKPMWGTWWVWDARLTSVLVLFFLYLGYMALWRSFDDPIKAGRAAAVLCLFTSVNLIVIKYSVDWWNTLHQPASVARLDGPRIHSSILTPLLVMAAGFKAYFLTVLIVRMRAELAGRRERRLRARAAAS